MTSTATCWSSYQVSALHSSMSVNVQIWDNLRVYVMPVILPACRQPAGNREGNTLLLLKPCVAPLSPPLHCLRQFQLQNDGLWLTCPAF